MQGQLGEKLIADLIREIAQKNGSGLLRLARGKSIKAIFFESGAPVFAISNVTTEQLDYALIKAGFATSEQIEQAKQKGAKGHLLGAALAEQGLLTESELRSLVRSQIMGIIQSLFEWTEGDYVLDERIRASHEITLDVSVADVLLEGARHAAKLQQIAEAIAPQDGIVVRSNLDGARRDSGRLMPVESYVLSRIESPIAVSEVGTLSGIGEEEAHRAVCVLVAAGLLKLLGEDKEEETSQSSDDSLERFREDVSRRIHFYSSADFYEILGVTRQATTSDIKAAYYQLAKKFHPDRYHQAEHTELRNKLAALFAKITQAYETLSEPAQRASYDERMRKSTGTLPAKQPLATTPLVPIEERKPTETVSASAAQPAANEPMPQAASEPIPVEQQPPRSTSPAQTAEHYYQQGRARYDRKEYHAAVHLLREAVKLDPSKPHYHFHLGIALIRNPRTRREAEEHLTKSAELDPYNSQIRVKLGILYKEAGLTKKAENYFREALSLDPENRVAKRELSTDSKKEPIGPIWKADLGSLAKRIFKK